VTRHGNAVSGTERQESWSARVGWPLVRPQIAIALVMSCAVTAGCDPDGAAHSPLGSDAAASPNISAQPRQLATHDARGRQPAPDAGATKRGGLLFGDGGFYLPDAAPPPPTPFGAEEVVPAEQLRRRELSGLVLTATWRWRDVPPPAETPQLSKEGLEHARKAAALNVRLELADTGRLRMVFDSVALPLPQRSELLARADRYGSIVLWPNGTRFRVLSPGALRTTLGEGRVDVTPLSPGKLSKHGQGARLEQETRKLRITSPLGTLDLETARLPEAGRAGPLLCRMLAELVGVDPSIEGCAKADVVLSAQFAWKDGGGVALEVTSITKRTDLPAQDFLVPPPGARYAASGLPASPARIFFTRDELEAFRTEAGEPPDEPNPKAPDEGFSARNQSDRLLYVLLDGVPVAATPPWDERYLIGPRPGLYSVQWRTFLGDFIGKPTVVHVPIRLTYGVTDAGAARPDGGP
jgi:hypothetical protein